MSFTDESNPLEDYEYPEPDEDDDTYDVVVCPHCGKEVFEDAEQCPSCSYYMTTSTNPWLDRPTWWIILGVVGVALTILTILFA